MIERGQAVRELFDQHEELREIMDDCEQLADAIDAGGGDLGALVREIAKLRVAFATHNRFEEEVLPSLLRDVDAIGVARIENVLTDHVDEHRALRQRLDGPTAELRATLYDLRAHLAAEDRMLISARVLRPDVMSVEPS